MADFITNFARYEKKYILTLPQYQTLQKKLAPHFTPDLYGAHTICSVYYDTWDYTLIQESLKHPVYKEKLRLRAYGRPDADSVVFLEIKKKFDGIVYKRRVALPMHAVPAWEETSLPPLQPPNPENSAQIWAELRWMRARYAPMRRSCMIAYERVALTGRASDALRITFDYHVRFRTWQLDPQYGNSGTELLSGLYLMEIKIPGAIPVFLARILEETGVHPARFSKYGAAYQNYIATCKTEGRKQHA